MSLLQLIIISIVQGISEWLPISSSAHVLLTAKLFGIGGQEELMVNAMAHLGTLFAVIVYFWRDVIAATRGAFELVGIGRRTDGTLSAGAKLALFVLIATPPGIAAGLVHEMVPAMQYLRGPYVIAATTIIFGLLLWWADVAASKHRGEADMNWKDAALIGLAQAVAFIPGVSRSGIAMTAARALGFARQEAARFGMLCGVPLLSAAGGYALLKLVTADEGAVGLSLNDGLIIAVLSFLSALASIWVLMAVIKRMSFLPFVIYRLGLGVMLLIATPMLGWV